MIAGATELGDIYAANAGVINAYTSFANIQSLATSQIVTPTFNNSNVVALGTTGATSYTYKVVFRDANVGATAASGAGGVSNGNATLSVSNYNHIVFALPSPSPAFIDVYRTASGGVPASTGKIFSTAVGNFKQNGGTTGPGRVGSIITLVDDTGLVGDGTTPPAINTTAAIQGFKVQTNTNCAAIGSSANPSIAACAAAPAGRFSCATNASTGTCQVNTSAVTSNSEVIVQINSYAGTAIGVTCATGGNVTVVPFYTVASINTGVSFTINAPTFTTNPVCYDYWIVN